MFAKQILDMNLSECNTLDGIVLIMCIRPGLSLNRFPPSLLMIFVSPTYKPQLIILPSYPYMESIFSNGFGESLSVMLAIE